MQKCELSRANQSGTKKIFTTHHSDVVSNSKKPVKVNYSPRKRVKSHASDQDSITIYTEDISNQQNEALWLIDHIRPMYGCRRVPIIAADSDEYGETHS